MSSENRESGRNTRTIIPLRLLSHAKNIRYCFYCLPLLLVVAVSLTADRCLAFSFTTIHPKMISRLARSSRRSRADWTFVSGGSSITQRQQVCGHYSASFSTSLLATPPHCRHGWPISQRSASLLSDRLQNSCFPSPQARWDSSLQSTTLEASEAIPDTVLHDDAKILDASNKSTAATTIKQIPVADHPIVINGDQTKTDSELESSLLEGLKSRPKPGGAWNVEDPLKWAEDFGGRSKEYEKSLQAKIKLKEGDEGYFDVSDMKVKGITIVRTKEQAKKVMKVLMNAPENIFHACDTEVMDIDLKQVGPVGNGYVTCASVYSGPDFDYGLGDGPGTTLWIDNLDDACGILQEFKPWFEDPSRYKVWHNYGFDRHVMWNEGIDCQGFGGDTMHMARLQDTSRGHGRGGYSLEALTGDLLQRRKRPMSEIFGVPRLRKDGSPGSILDIPPIEVMQRDPKFRENFIIYSAYDAEGTWKLHQRLCQLLQQKTWLRDGSNLFEYYWEHMREFGHVLTDMERRGIRVNAKDYLATVEKQARKDRDEHSRVFRTWAAKKIGPDGLALNPASALQLTSFLFGGSQNQKTKEYSAREREFKVSRDEIPEDALVALKLIEDKKNDAKDPDEESAEILSQVTAVELKALCKEQGLKLGGKKSEIQERLQQHLMSGQIQPANSQEQNSQTSADNDDGLDLESMKVKELKELCKENGLKSTGKKSLLVERLREHLNGGAVAPVAVAPITNDGIDLQSMTVKQLKELCKENDLKVSETKVVLMERLRENSIGEELVVAAPAAQTTPVMDDGIDDEFSTMSDDDLRNVLVTRGINVVHNSRAALLESVRGDISFAQNLSAVSPPSDMKRYDSLAEALDAFAAESDKFKEILDGIRTTKANQKYIDLTIRSLGLTPVKYTQGGAPSATADAIRELAGDPFADPPKYGTAYEFFGQGQEGHDACVALYSLCAIGSIDTMIANFFTSLQTLADHQSRVHCSLNLNTETGRLSSRRPNLQNQPALEKDKYKIRKAFESSPGNNLIVADYGQLELRLLASMTGCKSMISAFESGGDFHSRTAMDMFEHVRQKLDEGEVLLEWDYSKGAPPKPMLKDEFASERRKAKTLNFSIAYGKTAHGLSQDWGVSQTEAQEMLDKWYEARPEVRDWQKNTKAFAVKYGYTRTLMGRYRELPDAKTGNRKLVSAGERASINTPIQGGAADVAMMAMNKINDSEKLERLGWILLMQIHDEVILEGPEETAEEAFEEVLKCMQEPWVRGLPQTAVPLLVDGSYHHKTWYDAK